MTLTPSRLPGLRWAGAVAALALLTAAADAAPIKLARHPDYHNGKVVFSYLGDLWTAGDDGSSPTRLTVHRGRDAHPRFSPDGKWIAFSSNRYGNNDVFIMPAGGGRATQLTFHSGEDTVVGWSPDSKKVIFNSARGMLYPGIPNLYEVPVGGGLEQPILTDWGFWGSYSPDGSKLAFNRHPAQWSRKHYRGSYSADLWVMDVANNKFRRIVDDKLADEMKPNNFWPMYGQNGWIYFVSDRGTVAKSGTPEVMKSTNNLWKVNEEGGDPIQVTKHTSGALFFPSLSSDGKTIVYEQDFGLWKLDVASGESKEIVVDITTDDAENNLEALLINSEADSFHLSPTGKRAAVSVRGELFTIATEKGEVRRLTSTPSVREVQPRWSPDGKWIAFVGDKTGGDEVWLCDERGGQMKQISKGDSEKGQIQWSPDGKSLLYSGGNGLYRYDLDGGKTTTVASGKVVAFGMSAVFNPQWSPDGKWISYSKADRTLLPHVYVVPADGSAPEKRITEDGTYSDTLALWTPDGKRLVYIAGLDVGNLGGGGQSKAQIYSVALTPETTNPLDKGVDSEEEARKAATPGKSLIPPGVIEKLPVKVEVKIDFTKIGRRARQLTRVGDSITTMTIAPNGQSVLFVTSGTEGGLPVQSIWSAAIDGSKVTRVAQSVMAPPEGAPTRGPATGGMFSGLQFTKDGRSLYFQQGKGIYAVVTGGTLGDALNAIAQKAGAPTGAPSAGAQPRRVNFTARIDVDRRAERKQVFTEAWFIMKHRFYDPTMHGVDWVKTRAVYEPLLAHVGDQEELHNVVNLMIGELNASHTGVSAFGRRGGASEGTGNVTRFPGFELEADKSGYYRVKHVYKGGPADKDYVKVSAGDYILALDDNPLKSGENYWKTYTQHGGGKMTFTVNSKPAAEGAWKTSVQPISVAQLGSLQYQKWVDDRRAAVDRISNGQYGYLHIRQMDQTSLRQFERDLAMLGTKKALVIDQRFNPGGNIDQELLQILQQKQYQYTKMRGSEQVTRPLRGFFGPMVVMANERSTSDAEVFPDGFKTLKLGKVVGVTTYGAVIGTGGYQLMDGSMIRTPGTGLWNMRHVNLENNGVVPDVYVDNTPEDFFRGRDAQLERAVEVLRQELPKKK